MAGALRFCGAYLQPLFAGLDVRVAIAGSHANLAYRSRATVAIEVAAGLTDAHIARLPYLVRGKAGHGKPRDPEYLEQRGVHFHFEEDYLRGSPDVEPWRDVLFPVGLPARLVTWDHELMKELLRRDPTIQVADFEQVLDDYLADLPHKKKADVRRDLARFRRFYFDHNEDSERLGAFEAFLQ
jgi:hypothetical protein